jgi:hypothetical protein
MPLSVPLPDSAVASGQYCGEKDDGEFVRPEDFMHATTVMSASGLSLKHQSVRDIREGNGGGEGDEVEEALGIASSTVPVYPNQRDHGLRLPAPTAGEHRCGWTGRRRERRSSDRSRCTDEFRVDPWSVFVDVPEGDDH